MSESTNWLTGATPAEYHAYLLRVWRPNTQAEWRIMVEIIDLAQRRNFASLEELLAFLRHQLGVPPSIS